MDGKFEFMTLGSCARHLKAWPAFGRRLGLEQGARSVTAAGPHFHF